MKVQRTILDIKLKVLMGNESIEKYRQTAKALLEEGAKRTQGSEPEIWVSSTNISVH